MLIPTPNIAKCGEAKNWIIISQGKVLAHTETSQLPFLSWQQLQALHAYEDVVTQLHDLHGNPTSYYVVDLETETLDLEGYTLISLRHAMMHAEHEPFGVLGRAWQFVHFYQTHRYCGKCGSKMTRVDWEMAVHCHRCQHRCYPRVSPCVIVAIYREGEILLAKGVRHQSTGFYSTIAGFVESGEGLEDAVVREIKEEVGVNVKTPQYFGSQPWPFPHALMVGYLAEWESGDIVIDENEIADAAWFPIDSLPLIPPKFSIAGQLIDTVVKNRQGN